MYLGSVLDGMRSLQLMPTEDETFCPYCGGSAAGSLQAWSVKCKYMARVRCCGRTAVGAGKNPSIAIKRCWLQWRAARELSVGNSGPASFRGAGAKWTWTTH